MALQSKYHAFAANPSAAALADSASIHYVPTLISVSGPAAIQRHFASQNDQLKTKHNFLNVTEGPAGIAVEAETTIQFNFGGGAYLPGLDDNFTADRVVTLPTIHFVSFDAAQSIVQVRIYWDQASLLKAVDIIGARSKNWPVREAKDQVRLISSFTSGQAVTPSNDTRQSRGGANGDKYTSLSLFEKPQERVRSESPATSDVKPLASFKPPQRDLQELFVDGQEISNDGRPVSPVKEYKGHFKSGAGKNFRSSRLFEEGSEPFKSPPKSIKTDERKYQHFEFGEKPLEAPKEPRHTKGMSQWSFEDFVTPQKPKTKDLPAQSQRHIGWSDDEEEAKQPTVHRQHNPKPRPDSSAKFTLTDDNNEAEDTRQLPSRPGVASRGKGMFESNVLEGALEASATAEGKKAPAQSASDVNPHTAAAHRKHFGSQFEIEDGSPAQTRRNEATDAQEQARKKPEAAQNAQQHLKSNFDIVDDSPAKLQENKGRGINIQGDGMGSRKAVDIDAPKQRGINIQGDGMGSRKTGEKPWWEYE